jgi:hypothetical protein
MMHENIIDPLRTFITAAMKRRKYKGILEADDILNDLFIEFNDSSYTLEDYKREVNAKLCKEEGIDRNFSLPLEIRETNSENSVGYTKNKRATDALYKAKHNKQKCDWEKKEKKNNLNYRLKRLAGQVKVRLLYNKRRDSKEAEKCFLADFGKCIRQKVANQYKQKNTCPFPDKFLLIRGRCHLL